MQGRTPFPRWPVEPSLDDLLDRVLAWATAVAGRPVPWIAPWPDGHRWAIVLTHDVETDEGLRRMPLLRAVEERTGSRSSWNFVPGRYAVPDDLVAELQASGHEVGLHGLQHDGRDLEPGHFEQRLPEMRRHAERWGAVGFRSPATHRSWDAMARLPFAYDSSFPDTDPVRAAARRLLQPAAVLRRGRRRAAHHAPAGPHALRHPPRAGRGDVARARSHGSGSAAVSPSS